MKLGGVSIIRNGVKLGYPFVESIRSILPICGEFIVGVGDSEDETRKKIEEINDPRVRIIDSKWDTANRSGGTVLSQQTNIVLKMCMAEWAFYLQADEAVHEDDFEKIMGAIAYAEKHPEVDGIAFNYLHFYGSYFTVQTGRNWYRQEVRIVRNKLGIESHGDAQGFRKNGQKIKAIDSGARIFHYGWARPPDIMLDKIKSFHKFWHDDAWITKNCNSEKANDYFSDLGNLKEFHGTHPAVMKNIINRDNVMFINACQVEYLRLRGFGDRIRDIVRGLPFGDHRNFILVKG